MSKYKEPTENQELAIKRELLFQEKWKEKKKLAEEMVDLRMHLANAEIQANKVIGLLPTKYGLPCKVRWHIQEADDELCEIARAMGLDKIGLVEAKKLGDWGQGKPKRSKTDAKS